MVGQHPELAGLPELKLFSYATIGELDGSLPAYWRNRGITHRSPGLVRAIAEYVFGAQDAASIESARNWLKDRPDWTGADALDILMERATPRVAVEKSPENIESDDALNRLVSAFPNARYLHLTRHPVTTQRSIHEHWNRTFPGRAMEGQPMSGVASWVEANCRILQMASRLPEGRYIRVKAEDVLNDKYRQLRSIAAWLNLRVDDQAIEAMTHPEASPFASFGPESTGIIGGSDPSFMRDPIPRPVEVLHTLDRPAGWEDNGSLWQMTVDIATRLGYP
jgi:hypothetical protein